MKKFSLNGEWSGKCYKDGKIQFDFDGTVPGCVHTDIAGKHIPKDLFYRNNADDCQWIENCDFTYTKTFIPEKSGSAKLVFEGLDVYCDIYLNNKKLGSCDNMFIPHSFDISNILKSGENMVEVRFFSPIKAVQDKPALSGAFTTERMHTRRIQCTYGWDWVARFVTMGIFRDVYLEYTGEFDADNIYVYTDTIEKDYAQIVIEAEFKNCENGGFAEIEILSPDGKTVYNEKRYVKEKHLKEYIDIENPELWYPSGYGSQSVYTAKICGISQKFGIRTAKVIQIPDAENSEFYKKCKELQQTASGQEYDFNKTFSGFELLINGTKIMCMGANWVPCEPFPSEESDEKITRILTLARDGGVNMIRVWGGGIFKKQHFYDECDRLGILVTQDFLMACGRYPEDDNYFIKQVKKEAEYAALILRNHPCLVWWSGDNENAVRGHFGLETYTGRRVVNDAILPALNKLDPHRRFFASSPYGGKLFASKTAGTTHNTQFLNIIFRYMDSEDMTDYKDYWKQYTARFIAEEPAMGACNISTLRKFMTDDDIFKTRDMWLYHTKGNPSMSKELFYYIETFAEKALGSFKNPEDRLFKLQYIHFEWIRISMELARRSHGFCNGIIYWMLNDCWPAAAGWSIIDYYCMPKAAYYSFKRCSKKLVALIDKETDYTVTICGNDDSVKTKIYYIKDNKITILADREYSVDGCCTVCTISASDVPDNAVLICDVKGGDKSDRAFYKKGNLDISVCENIHITTRDNNTITLKANSYVHTVRLEGECVFEDNWFSLIPGEERTIKFDRHADIKVTGYTISLQP